MIYPLIDEILSSKTVINRDGNPVPLRGNINREEGLFLHDLVQSDPSITRTLEIGCAFALSSLFICGALEGRNNPQHLLLDPFQQENYQGIGVLNLERAGVDFFKLIEEKSEFALPKLLEMDSASFDLIFIDGLHSFDQAALDFYFANRLVKVGGYIVFDDASFKSVSKVISFALKYPAYHLHSQVRENSGLKKFLRFWFNLIPEFIYTTFLPLKLYHFRNRLRFSSMVALQKVAEDDRSNRWFDDF